MTHHNLMICKDPVPKNVTSVHAEVKASDLFWGRHHSGHKREIGGFQEQGLGRPEGKWERTNLSPQAEARRHLNRQSHCLMLSLPRQPWNCPRHPPLSSPAMQLQPRGLRLAAPAHSSSPATRPRGLLARPAGSITASHTSWPRSVSIEKTASPLLGTRDVDVISPALHVGKRRPQEER